MDPEPSVNKIGGFLIEALIDKGPLSHLYLATDPQTHKPIVIKTLSPDLSENQEAVQRFLEEAKIIRLQNHPNIVKLLDSGSWEGGLFIAMEYVDGLRLREVLKTIPLSLRKRIEILLEIAYAICHLHTHRVIHRDLKPENILIDGDFHVKVIDFGISHLMTSLEVKRGRRFIGTPVYMSPEQKENPNNLSYPSDIYSLGIIAYELIVGKIPHGTLLLSLLPKGLQPILAKALQPDPQERYLDMVDFIGDLSHYLHSEEIEENEKEFFSGYKELENWMENEDRRVFPSGLMKASSSFAMETESFFGSISRKFFWHVQEEEGRTRLLFAKGPGTFWKNSLAQAFLQGAVPSLFRQKKQHRSIIEELHQELSDNYFDPLQYAFLDISMDNILLSHSEEFLLALRRNGVWAIAERFSSPLGASTLSLQEVELDIPEKLLLFHPGCKVEHAPFLRWLNAMEKSPFFLKKLSVRARFSAHFSNPSDLVALLLTFSTR